MFKTILIANRGEIACRVIRTSQRLGIKTIAVYSDADQNALHTKLADQAYDIGPSAVNESYLRADKILHVAHHAGAQAIHPGYGLLSENASFARLCHEKGVKFIGPSAQTIEIMGSKGASKMLMEQIGVPIVPGYHGEEQSLKILTEHAHRIGFPLLIKASSGGGGKGMRVVSDASSLLHALESARREVEASFKEGRLLLEKLILSPRHVEVQIFGDTHGHLIHLFERDCSLQRRYQKIVEEAPAPQLSESTREKIHETALKVGRAARYENAGTVEFLLDAQDNFYFMEVNTRLQVEHPVTEMITGLDLVEWQLRVASGEPLPLLQEEITKKGHAIETRLCAENPLTSFLPTTGVFKRFDLPSPCIDVRYETGITQKSVSTVHYDSLIAKVIAWGETREEALKKLKNSLMSFKIQGVINNKSYLLALLNHKSFEEFNLSTHFIEENHHQLIKDIAPPPEGIVLAALTKKLLRSQKFLSFLPQEVLFYRMNNSYQEKICFTHGDQSYEVEIMIKKDFFTCFFLDKRYEGKILESTSTSLFEIELEGQIFKVDGCLEGSVLFVDYAQQTFSFTFTEFLPKALTSHEEEEGLLCSPMPGKIIALKAHVGKEVKKGEPVVILEAMKMEHVLKAPFTGIIQELPFSEGSVIEEGVEVAILKPLSTSMGLK